MGRKRNHQARLSWEHLAGLLAKEPAAYDYIQGRRRRGVPAEGLRRQDWGDV